MNIRGIVVCVDYADLLQRSLERWLRGADVLIVTKESDRRTRALFEKYRYRRDLHRLDIHFTDIFHAKGAVFNKGAAMSEAAIVHGWREGADWLMTFDADTVPPEHWWQALDGGAYQGNGNTAIRLRPGLLYGARRYYSPEDVKELIPDYNQRMPQSWVIGFFTLFHASDPHLPSVDEPVFDLCWPHAGNYDTIFCRRWPKSKQVILDLPMIHLGRERQHWCGRGDRQRLRDMFLDQRRGHEDWDRERLAEPPEIVWDGRRYTQGVTEAR